MTAVNADTTIWLPLASLLATATLAVALWYALDKAKQKPGFLPGPPALPLLGNLLHIPLKHPWAPLSKLTAQYGDAIYFHGLGNSYLVVNTWEAVTDIVVRLDRITCSRPHLVVASDLFDLAWSTALAPNGEIWKTQRTLARQTVADPEIVRTYDPVVEEIGVALVKDLIASPGNFFDTIRLAASRVNASTVYGIYLKSASDPFVTVAEEAMGMISSAVMPGEFLVDLVPVLRYIPKWVPFARFHKVGAMGRKIISDLTWNPIKRVKAGIEAGTAPPSFLRDLMTNAEDDEKSSEFYFNCVRWAAASMYAAGQEVVAAPVINLCAVMAQNPHVLKKAHAELDEVLGNDRIPTIADRKSLPYIWAIVQELLRISPPLPLSIPRCSMEDIVYRGKIVPEGTTIFPNLWALSRMPDPEYDPEVFAPERFLRANPPLDPTSYCFGFGRRSCPGQYLAENFLFIATACMLSAFDIQPVDGQKDSIKVQWSSGLVSVPSRFNCTLKPRSSAHKALWEGLVTENY